MASAKLSNLHFECACVYTHAVVSSYIIKYFNLYTFTSRGHTHMHARMSVRASMSMPYAHAYTLRVQMQAHSKFVGQA